MAVASGRRKTRSWLQGHRRDAQVRAARSAGWRSRAAAKLVELDDALGLLAGARGVVDLGAAPGGWAQIAVSRTGDRVPVVGVDLLAVAPLAGAVFIQGDFTSAAVRAAAVAAASGRIDLVLCDAAPDLSGIGDRDVAQCELLHEAAVGFGVDCQAGRLVLKSFNGQPAEYARQLLRDAGFKAATRTLAASKKGSREVYLVGRRQQAGQKA